MEAAGQRLAFRSHRQGNVWLSLPASGATLGFSLPAASATMIPPMGIVFSLNGQREDAAEADPHQPLLHYLRQRGLTGTKEGCAEGECGACAVVLVKRDPQGRAQYEPVNSCLVLLGSVADQEVISVEGVARDGELHPVQQAMVELGGSQCGYCTPGFIMSLFAEFYRAGRSSYDPESIGGNLCRCTGYRPIRDACTNMGAPASDDPFRKRLQLAPPELSSFQYDCGRRFFRPRDLKEVFELLEREAKAVLVAGGTDLVVEMNQRYRRFDCIVSLENVSALRKVAWSDDALSIGAAVTLTEIEHAIEDRLPLLSQLLPLFSSRLIRNRATLGGNLATASPIGDGPPALLALGAEVELQSATAKRRIPLAQFFIGYRKTAMKPGEILTAVRIPRPFPQLQRFYKVSKRVLDDISTVAAGFAVVLDAQGVITNARLAYGGVAATPLRAEQAEQALVGKPWDSTTVKIHCKALGKRVYPH